MTPRKLARTPRLKTTALAVPACGTSTYVLLRFCLKCASRPTGSKELPSDKA